MFSPRFDFREPRPDSDIIAASHSRRLEISRGETEEDFFATFEIRGDGGAWTIWLPPNETRSKDGDQ